jgi:hypothetical protein
MKKTFKTFILFFLFFAFFYSNVSAQTSTFEECNDPELSKEAELFPCSFIPPVDKEEVPTKGSEIIELPVDSFDNSLTGWTKTGTTPYLNYLDYATNYISTTTTGSTGVYGFKNSDFNLGTITKVELMMYCRWGTLQNENNFSTSYVRNGSTFVSLGGDTCTTSWAWKTFDITSTANLSVWNFTTINNTEYYIAFQKVGGEATVLNVDQMKLRITYDPVVSGGAEPDPTIELVESGTTEAEFYLDKTISYGDVIVFVFLSLFTIGIICKSIGDFIFNRN